MNRTERIRASLRAASILAVLAVAFACLDWSVKHYRYQILEQHAEDIKFLVQANLAKSSASVLGNDVQDILRLPSVTGIEVFAPDGRRIGAYGEPLEIVGYRLVEIRSLRHIAAANTRYETYWSAAVLDDAHGIAIRVDQSVVTAGDRALLTKLAAILASTGLLCLLIFCRSRGTGNRQRGETEG